MIKKYIDIPIYNQCFLLVVGDTDIEIKKYLNKYLKTDLKEDFEFIGLTGKTKDVFYLALTDKNRIDILAHEVLHLTQDILEYVGVMHKDYDANEAYCYLHGYLVDKIYKILNK